jgi:hypothetical protein
MVGRSFLYNQKSEVQYPQDVDCDAHNPNSEYSHPEPGRPLDPAYMQDVEDYYRKAGIVMPLISNDGFDYGNFVPGSGVGAVDIYGHDSYPLGFSCSQPYNWTGDYFSTDFHIQHENQSHSTPYAISEVCK